MFGARIGRSAALVAAAAIAMLTVDPAGAAIFRVDSTVDEADANVGDGVCATASGACTLRAAVNEANDGRSRDTIVLPAGTYTLTIPPGPVNSTSFFGDLDVVFDLSIRGAGADVTIIDANQLDRAFQVRYQNGDVFLRRLQLRGVSVVNGNPPENHGGGIFGLEADIRLVDSVVAGNTADLGGGIDLLAGRLTLVRSRVSGNVGRRCCGGIRAVGDARVVIDRSDVSENRAEMPGATGGGILCFSGTELQISRSTVRGNRAAGGAGGIRFIGERGRIVRSVIEGNRADGGAGGISVHHADPTLPVPGPLLIVRSEVVGNRADADGDEVGSGGGIFVNHPSWASPNEPILQRTTVAGNLDGGGTAPDCSGIMVDRGGNTLGDPAGCLLLPPH